jgi:adenosylcobinamide-GDP ribazoletransferase
VNQTQRGNASANSLAIGPLIDFLVALQFLSISPPLFKRLPTARELGRASGYFPLVGILIGALLAAGHFLLSRVFPTSVSAALLLTLWIVLTGALHLDGFLDSCDGLLGGRTPQKRLEIMKDERVGAFGLAGGVLLILLKFTALSNLSDPHAALLVAPALARWGMTVSIFAFPYARVEGLGRTMKDSTGLGQVLLASAITLGVCWVAGGIFGVVLAIVAVLVVWLFCRFVLRLIPGMTGDTYGALNELIELVVLLAYAVPGFAIIG